MPKKSHDDPEILAPVYRALRKYPFWLSSLAYGHFEDFFLYLHCLLFEPRSLVYFRNRELLKKLDLVEDAINDCGFPVLIKGIDEENGFRVIYGEASRYKHSFNEEEIKAKIAPILGVQPESVYLDKESAPPYPFKSVITTQNP